jgi:hypothetical protein
MHRPSLVQGAMMVGNVLVIRCQKKLASKCTAGIEWLTDRKKGIVLKVL